MTITQEHVSFPVDDGTTMGGHLVRPAGGSARPALLLLQEIFGVNEHIRDLAERLAREGYVVLAPDLFHRKEAGYLGSYEDIPASIAVAMKYGPADSEADLRAAHAFLEAHPSVRAERVGAIGFCMGGRLAFVANAVLPLRAAVSFYGNIAPDKLAHAPAQRGPLLLVWAGNDAHIPLENRRATGDALREHRKDFVEVEVSGKNHGFFCDARSDYDATAAAIVWPLTLAFLTAHLSA
jgi:carboxymethylenebutenolidase